MPSDGPALVTRSVKVTGSLALTGLFLSTLLLIARSTAATTVVLVVALLLLVFRSPPPLTFALKVVVPTTLDWKVSGTVMLLVVGSTVLKVRVKTPPATLAL